ncbi:hypothetical protein KM043_003594 [Ampulex compressa]|nr:hypothetical protein KM043_003594 [Ampulex compressa]
METHLSPGIDPGELEGCAFQKASAAPGEAQERRFVLESRGLAPRNFPRRSQTRGEIPDALQSPGVWVAIDFPLSSPSTSLLLTTNIHEVIRVIDIHWATAEADDINYNHLRRRTKAKSVVKPLGSANTIAVGPKGTIKFPALTPFLPFLHRYRCPRYKSAIRDLKEKSHHLPPWPKAAFSFFSIECPSDAQGQGQKKSPFSRRGGLYAGCTRLADFRQPIIDSQSRPPSSGGRVSSHARLVALLQIISHPGAPRKCGNQSTRLAVGSLRKEEAPGGGGSCSMIFDHPPPARESGEGVAWALEVGGGSEGGWTCVFFMWAEDTV